MKFYGELGRGLETNCLHFGDDTIRITIRIRESVPDHHPDPGKLAFGGGLCSLSTFSFIV